MRPIYLDFASTTPLAPAVWDAMRPYCFERFGNPSSSHQFGRQARRGLDEARGTIARLLDCQPDEIIFTSGATEANNLAVLGLACAPESGLLPSLLSSAIEHPCVVEPVERLARAGYRRVAMEVNGAGAVALPDTPPAHLHLATLMLANHETGALQPVRPLADLLSNQANPVALHCDAAAAAGKMPISFRGLGVTTLALSAHKFCGPRGIGALLVKRGTRLTPLLWGGHQQHSRRPGTEPVALAVGMARALEIALDRIEAKAAHVRLLREHLLARLAEAAPMVVNSHDSGLPHTVNVSFPGCKADALLMKLDLAGVACATGSACSSGSLQPSPVLRAMRLPGEVVASALRFSFAADQGLEEMDEAGARIVHCVKELRRIA